MSTVRFSTRLAVRALLAACVSAAANAQSGMTRETQLFPTGARETSVVLLERVGPAEVRVGAAYEYQVNLINLTDAPIRDVELSEQLGAGFKDAAITPPPTARSGAQAIWRWETLNPRETKAIRVSGSARGVAEVAGCATVTFKTFACSTTRLVQPALELVKEAPAEVLLCDPIPLRFVVTNTGTGVARDVRVADPLPDGWTTSDGRRELLFSAGDLGAGQSREFTASVRADRTGRFVNQASASEEGGLSDDASTTTLVRKPELRLVKTAPPYRFIGRPATYELRVTNTGDAPARDTSLVDELPRGVTFVSATDGGQLAGERVTWRLGTLAPGESRSVSMEVLAREIGLIRNAAVARAYCAEASAAVELEARGIPAILLEVIDLEDPVELGQETTYDITVVNQGSSDGTNIVIACTLPSEEQFVSANGPTQHSVSGQQVRFAPLPSLAPKARVTYRVTVKGVAAGDVRFGVSMRSDQTTSPVEETESTHVY